MQGTLQWALRAAALLVQGLCAELQRDSLGPFLWHGGTQQRGEPWIRVTSEGQSWGIQVRCVALGIMCVAKCDQKLLREVFLSRLWTIFFSLWKQVLFSSPSCPSVTELQNWLTRKVFCPSLQALPGSPCPWTVRRTSSTTSSGNTGSPRTEASEAHPPRHSPIRVLIYFLSFAM